MRARWEVIARAVELAKAHQPDPALRPLIIGNGDVQNLADGYTKVAQSGCDGMMIGRGICGNPWFFNPAVDRESLPVPEVLRVMLEHTHMYMQLHGPSAPLEPLKKHFKSYVNHIPGAPGLRAKLMHFTDYGQLRRILEDKSAALGGG